MALDYFQGKPFNITVIQVYAPTTDAEEAELSWFYEEGLQHLLELAAITAKKEKEKSPFAHRGLGCKSRKSRDTQNNRQVWPWSTKWSRAKVNRVLSRENNGNSTHVSSNTVDGSTHGPPQMVNTKIRLIILFVAEDEEDFYSQQKQNLVLTVAQFINSLLWTRLKLKKVGKTTRSFKYDLNESLMTIQWRGQIGWRD